MLKKECLHLTRLWKQCWAHKNMDEIYYKELIENLNKSLIQDNLPEKSIYLFGHCEATLTLANEMEKIGLVPKAILDNSSIKYGIDYKGIPVVSPDNILNEDPKKAIVLIATRFYESMNAQLRKSGFYGQIRKLVDYNTFAEYSLSEYTYRAKRARCGIGSKILIDLETDYWNTFFVFCPFPALGDIYFCMSYLPYFKKQRKVDKTVVCVPSRSCADVVGLFGGTAVILAQKELEAAIQAVYSLDYENAFVAHQDRPYTINLHQALRIKKIPLEDIYRIGVFGLNATVKPLEPNVWSEFPGIKKILKGKAAILSPYAKSVTALPEQLWKEIVNKLKNKGYALYTNVAGNEKPLEGTEPISPRIPELKSVVEQAGLFIGIRSGLCDVLRTAKCKKIALFPDYNYCDTKWKSIDIYSLDGFENIVVGKEYKWQMK